MTLDRTQQQSGAENYSEFVATANHAGRRMSHEAHQHGLDFRPSFERELSHSGDGTQHAMYRPDQAAAQFVRTARHARFDRNNDRSYDSGYDGGNDPVGREMRAIGRGFEHAASIVQNAFDAVGERLWSLTQFKHAVRNGRLGCAASVSKCLQRTGFDYADHAGVGGLVDQLMQHGWTKHPISEARPGDVIYGYRGNGWRSGGGNAHIGIMGENGTAYGNSSNSGQWTKASVDGVIGARRFGQNRYCLRPPGGGAGEPDQGVPQFDRRPPMEGGRPPMDGSRPPIDDRLPPMDGRRPPMNDRRPPLDDRRPPMDSYPPNRNSRQPDNGGIDVIMDGSTTATDKLAAVQRLAHNGVSQFNFQGADGQTYSMRTETQSVGSREMVHLFITLPDGKERVVLRGIARSDGSFEQEKSSNGNSVDFYGKGAATVYGGDGAARRDRPDARDLYQFDGTARRGTSDLYQFDGGQRGSPVDASQDQGGDRQNLENQSGRRPNPYSRPNRSIYDRYREEEDRRQLDHRSPFGDTGPDNGNQGSINKIIDDAQRAANNSANQLIRTPQGVYMRARMDIDADGSPRARQIDPTGQTQTSMRYTDGSSVNAEEVPYMVLPGGQYSQFGIKLGDMCLVRNRENGKVTVAVFADVGPRQKRGEGSMKLAEELGINNSPTHGGITKPNIEYLVLPGSGYPAQNQRQLLARINAQKQRLGLS